MENKEYYYPDIEDLFVGYECEVNYDKGFSEEFKPLVIEYKDNEGTYTNELSFIINMIDDGFGEIRTKYLDKEDIESEGWKYIGKSIDIWFELEGTFERTSWTSYKAILHYNLKDKWLFIHLRDQGAEHEIFEGKCLSINELRKIQKYLNIKTNVK